MLDEMILYWAVAPVVLCKDIMVVYIDCVSGTVNTCNNARKHPNPYLPAQT